MKRLNFKVSEATLKLSEGLVELLDHFHVSLDEDPSVAKLESDRRIAVVVHGYVDGVDEFGRAEMIVTKIRAPQLL